MLKDWLLLYFTPTIGINRFHALLKAFGSPTEALKADNNAWQTIGLPVTTLQNRQEEKAIIETEKSLAWVGQNSNHHIITFDDPLYPALLKTIPDAPPILFVKGRPEILSSPQIAIVGTRHPSLEGKHHSYLFAKELAERGFIITSGLAIGVDGEAHTGAVENHKKTIAVLGTGIEELYPKRHRRLSELILENQGALVSEFPLLMSAKAGNFPRRNRIIAGLSLGTLVVEAARKSGSLITAHLALDYNREVFAIPGSIQNPLSKGTHQLIREGAMLTETTYDIIETLSGWQQETSSSHPPQAEITFSNLTNEKPMPVVIANETMIDQPTVNPQAMDSMESATNLSPTASLTPQQQHLIALLKTPLTIDELVETLRLEASLLMRELLALELEGYIINIGSGRYQQAFKNKT